EPENVVYPPSAVHDLETAMAHLRDHWGITTCRATGLCSGAYHAFRGAVAGLPLSGVVPINPLVYHWKSGMSLEYPDYKVAEAASEYRGSHGQADKWRKLLTGKVRIMDVAHIAGRHVAKLASGFARELARRIGRPLPNDLGAELEAVARLNLELRF